MAQKIIRLFHDAESDMWTIEEMIPHLSRGNRESWEVKTAKIAVGDASLMERIKEIMRGVS